MRIVYDDRKATEFSELIDEILDMLKYVSGTRCVMDDGRVRYYLVRKYIDTRLGTYYIGNDVTHAHGIGNNNRYPVYYKGSNELEQCCFININQGLYSECYLYLTDWNNDRFGYTYEINRHGVSKKSE